MSAYVKEDPLLTAYMWAGVSELIAGLLTSKGCRGV